MSSKALIIPAAGSGSRMEKETPKPFLRLSGATILEHTIRRFLPLQGLCQVIVPTSENYIESVRSLLKKMLPQSVEGVSLAGGAERQDSIFKALQEVTEVDLVIVHDAVRPFVQLSYITTCCRVALENGAAVVGVPAKDTIKRIDDEQVVLETPSRNYLWQTQTPQIFGRKIILEAYQKAREEGFAGTDDASLVERLGHQVKMVKGDRSNFKITYPLDLELAELLINKEQH